MKIAALVCTIISLVYRGLISLCVLIALFATMGRNSESTIVIGILIIVLMTIGLISSITSLVQMRHRKPAIGICILVLLFGSLSGGICLLCISPQVYQKNAERETINRLLQYKQLADNGIISEEQFLKIKQKILE